MSKLPGSRRSAAGGGHAWERNSAQSGRGPPKLVASRPPGKAWRAGGGGGGGKREIDVVFQF